MQFRLRRGFTLVEMLIVIVIIGLLAASLIPKISGMQGRARDTVRKADLSQLGSAMYVYYNDNAAYPSTGGSTSEISTALSQYLTSIPKDPSVTRAFSGVDGATVAGEYGYMPIKKNGISKNAFVFMAATEEGGTSSNRVFDSGFVIGGLAQGEFTNTVDFVNVMPLVCPSVVRANGNTNSLNTGTLACKSNATTDSLRYVYMN